jgi:hypothetical protein
VSKEELDSLKEQLKAVTTNVKSHSDSINTKADALAEKEKRLHSYDAPIALIALDVLSDVYVRVCVCVCVCACACACACACVANSGSITRVCAGTNSRSSRSKTTLTRWQRCFVSSTRLRPTPSLTLSQRSAWRCVGFH